jgi:HlyD family secretion protein
MWKWLLSGAVLLAVAVGLAVRNGTGEAQPAYRTAPVARDDVVVVVTATGTINPVTAVQVGSQISGIIARLHVDFNASVTAGSLLAELDASTFQAQVLQAEASLEKARAARPAAQAGIQTARANLDVQKAELDATEANLRRAQVSASEEARNFMRSRDLAARKLVAAADLDRIRSARDQAAATVDSSQASIASARCRLRAAEATVASAGAALRSAEADIRQRDADLQIAQVNLARTRIVSPVDGVVISRNVDVGQTVAASLSAPTLFVIARDLTRMQINTAIDEADIGKIEPGQPVRFTVDSHPGREFSGTVNQVRLGPIVTQNVVTYDCVVSVPNPDRKLLPGMTASVAILVDRADDVLCVPAAALSFKPIRDDDHAPGQPASRRAEPAPPRATPGRGSRRTGHLDRARLFQRRQGADGQVVHVLGSGNRPEAIPVKIGLADGRRAELKEGALAAGQLVIVGYDGAPDRAGRAASSNPFSLHRPRVRTRRF